ncbi:DUF6411 family protein [Nocardioides aequoreus]|uniref:DUF6411 family protein n=1 Tax=Nocardioides aequoreus TaxID=397278 RepID=UPI0004C2DB0A|nr:DUF6411 family protein [Nocardioides aequoreus]
MVIAVIVVLVVVLAVLAFLLPKLSRHPQRATQKTAGAAGNTAGKLPGPLGRWGRKPFDSTSKWAGKGAAAGRKGRRKVD